MEELVEEITIFLKGRLQSKTPFDIRPDSKREKVHKGRTAHIKDIAYTNVGKYAVPIGTTGSYSFDIGNDEAEMNYPYYHILEDAQVIHKRDKGTKSSKGSQESYAPRFRDYGAWNMRETKKEDGSIKRTFYQEYRKNVRGSRSKIIDGKSKSSTTYVNSHYHWIEKALESYILLEMETNFGLKRKRTQIDYGDNINLDNNYILP